MTQSAAIQSLKRLLLIEFRSLPMYLAESCPWLPPGAEKAGETLENITLDQREYTGRLVAMIEDLDGRADFGTYPVAFTDMHMLSLEYLLGEIARRQHRVIPAVEQCVAVLEPGSPARSLAEEILGSEKAHLEALEELDAQPAV